MGLRPASLDGVTAWEEVADGVFRRRYQPHDVSVCVVRGTGGLLVCDTRSSHREADEIRADLKELGTQPVRWVVNTHAHFLALGAEALERGPAPPRLRLGRG
jgi:glyoxylase-like metal-dependent hydrolase (beta-lactamase superfamily II)